VLLPFTDDLVVTYRFDPEMALLADDHYSRRTVGSPQFMPPGEILVIRNTEGTLIFGWLLQNERDDKQEGINCSIFRNTSERRSSDVILECEELARKKWGPRRMFTYINPEKIKTRSRNVERWTPGHCFIKAGWTPVRCEDGTLYRSTKGLILLEKK
jgi:hypothetical protein